jgi:quinol monooxygenase YgiN
VTYVVIAHWTAREGEVQAVECAIRQLAAATHAEPGCRTYQLHRDPQDSRRFVIYEEYDDEAAFSAHAESEHFRRHALQDAIPRLESRGREFLVSWDG